MAKKQSVQKSLDITRITRTLYFFLGFFALSIIVFDAGNLLTRDAVIDRWSLLTLLFIINTIAWFYAAQEKVTTKIISTYALTATTLALAGTMTYWERGMASTSTILYALPLLISATLKNRHALIGTAALSVGTYAYAAVAYFNTNFNEGYRIQLWGSTILFSGSIFVSAWLLMVIAGIRKDSK